MELNIFLRELESALVQRGIPNETALEQVAIVRRSITSDDLPEIEAIQSPEKIEQMADSLVSILNRNRRQQSVTPAAPAPAAQAPVRPQEVRPAANRPAEYYPPANNRPADYPPAQTRPPKEWQTGEGWQDEPEDDGYASDAPYADRNGYVSQAVQQRPQAPAAPARRTAQEMPRKKQARAKEQVEDYFEYGPDAEPSAKGMILFWVGLFLTAPITLGLLAVMFAVFAALFVVMAALIVVSIVAVIGLVAAGAVTSLVAVVFGITQLFHIGGGTVIAGIYEIGLGVMVAGIVLFLAVLLYNFAIRFLPWVISKLASFLGFLCGKVKELFFYVRRECYQL